jgi:hypothetical protein
MWISYLEGEDESVDILKIVPQEVDDLIDRLLFRLQVLVEAGGVHHRHLDENKGLILRVWGSQ